MKRGQPRRTFLREVATQLYTHNISTIVAGAIVAALLAIVLWQENGASTGMAVWLALVECVYIGRYFLSLAYFRSPPGASRAWLIRFRTALAVQGSLWGTAAFLFFPLSNAVSQIAFLFAISGLAGGAAIAFAIDIASVLWFVVPLTTPLAAWLFYLGTPDSAIMGTMVVLYIAYVVVALPRSSATIRENLRLRLAAARREAEIRERNALLNGILENEPECVKVIAPDGQLEQMNKAGLAMLEVGSVEEANAAGLLNFVHPDHRAAFRQMLNEVLQGDSRQLEFQVIGKRGTLRWLDTNSTPLRNADGEIVALLGVTRNITARKEVEARLAESRQLLDNIVEHIPNMLFLKDADTLRYRMFNRAAEVLLGRTREEMLGKTDHDFFPPKQADFFTGSDRKVLAAASADGTGEANAQTLDISEEAIDTPTGMRILHTQKIALAGKDGKPRYLLGISEDITERKRHDRVLRESEEKLRGLYELAPLGIALTDMSGRYIEFNQAFLDICGYPADELKQLDYWELTPIKYEAQETQQLEALRTTGRYGPYEKEYIRKDGSLIPLRFNGMLVTGRDGEKYIWSIVEDITGSRQAEREVRIAATAFEAQEGLVITDEKARILRVNKAFTDITGYTLEDVAGKNPSMLSSGRHDDTFFKSMWKDIERSGSWSGEVWNRRKDGRLYPEHLTITSVKDASGKVINYVGSLTDITQRKASEEEIQRLAFYDHLTGLPNRRLFMDRLKQALAFANRARRSGALLFIDMDNFKNLNDTLGHDYGDLLLQQIAERLSASVREGDTVARLGGDEFVVLLEDLARGVADTVPLVETLGKKILDVLGQPYSLNGTRYASTPSIGVTLVSGRHSDAESLLKQADIAMYQAKRSGRNTLRFFDEKMQEAITRRAELETDLRGALERDEIVLYYQVQTSSLNKTVGAEVLVRWRHPKRGMIPPSEFIPLAEETGLILPLGKMVIERVCAQLRKWEDNELTRNLALAVNVSARQFHQPHFAEQVAETVRRHGINPGRLKLELTETLVLQNVEETVNTMTALNEIGAQISLDDFGTGYSSLQYLKRLPLDQLKIDQSFVRDLGENTGSLAIVQTIIAMADAMGLDIIAEGVETEQQRRILQRSGCTHFQGYLFGMPMPLAEFEGALGVPPQAVEALDERAEH